MLGLDLLGRELALACLALVLCGDVLLLDLLRREQALGDLVLVRLLRHSASNSRARHPRASQHKQYNNSIANKSVARVKQSQTIQ